LAVSLHADEVRKMLRNARHLAAIRLPKRTLDATYGTIKAERMCESACRLCEYAAPADALPLWEGMSV
jgi:hypothetical protein